MCSFYLSLLLVVLFNEGYADPVLPTAAPTEFVFPPETHEPPAGLQQPMFTEPRLLVSGGPGNPRVTSQTAMLNPILSIFENATVQILDDIKDGLRYLFQTNNHWTLALSGTGHQGMEAVLDNLLEPGDKILIPLYGMWPERASSMATRFGATVHNIQKPYGEIFTLEEIEQAIVKFQPNVVYLVNAESSTAVFQPVEGVGELCEKHNCLLAVDVVTSVGLQPFFMDKWKVDAVFCNTHKGIASPAGLAPVSFSPRAIDKMIQRQSPTRSWVHDFKNWRQFNYWKMDPNVPQPLFHSLPLVLLYGIRDALAKFAEEGLTAIWRRHAETHKYFVEKVEKLIPRIEYYVANPKNRLLGGIAYLPPSGVSSKEISNHLRTKYRIDASVGLGTAYGKIIRFGFYGPNSNMQMADIVANALNETYHHFANKNL